MIDFFASATIALIIVMTLVVFFSNRRQALILKQMRLVMDDWYQAKMRDRRAKFRDKFKVPDGLKWLSGQINLDVIEQGRKLENPRAVEYFTTEGARVVISPLPKKKLRSELRKAEKKRRKVAKLVEPMLGYKPHRVQTIERSIETAHEWFDLEIEAALKSLNINWGELDGLFIYLIPQITVKQRTNKLAEFVNQTRSWLHAKTTETVAWFVQRLSKVSG